MIQHNPNLQLSILIFLIATGIMISFTGIYIVDDTSRETDSIKEYHDFEQRATDLEESKPTLYGSTYPVFMQSNQSETFSPAAQKGMTVGELMRLAGIFAVVSALIILLLIEFVFKHRINRLNYRVLLIISLFILPVIVGLGASATVLETTKTVQSCGTCHVMDPFVNDLYDPGSTTLAARHYKNRWIPEYQCYTCHTTYGAHGTFEGKRDGFRHWLLFVTRTWDEPISYSGSYPNMNCTACHGGTTTFQEVPSHRSLYSKLSTDEVSCTSCHGPAHPTPNERDDVPVHQNTESQSVTGYIDTERLTKLMEALDE